LEICWDEEITKIKLHWSTPIPEKKFFESPVKEDNGSFYAIIGRWGKTEDKICYVGMTYKQNVVKRLKQNHGLSKCKKPQKRPIYISIASIEKGDFERKIKPLVKDIEFLLIYSLYEDDSQNKTGIYGYCGRAHRQLLIENSGYRGIPRKIFWGAVKSV
jgi:hypothetical protein